MTTVGKRMPLIDGPDKVADKAAYTADLVRPPLDMTDPESWRDAAQSDLVNAVGIAVWRAGKHVPTSQRMDDKFTQMMAEHFEKENKHIV